jgi:hypothetical protein
VAELEPVRPDWTRPDEKFIRPDETGFFSIFAGFLPDFCQFDVKNEPDAFRPDRMQKIRPVPTLTCGILVEG